MKKIMKLLPVVIMVCLVFTSVFAVNVDNIDKVVGGGKPAGNITTAAQNIWSTISNVILILAAAAIVFAGLRYMFASADQKADIKKSMSILAIGALMVFGSTAIIKLLASATDVFNTTK